MKITKEMYTTLFNAITDATRLMETACNILSDVQVKAEEIYINLDDEYEK